MLLRELYLKPNCKIMMMGSREEALVRINFIVTSNVTCYTFTLDELVNLTEVKCDCSMYNLGQNVAELLLSYSSITRLS